MIKKISLFLFLIGALGSGLSGANLVADLSNLATATQADISSDTPKSDQFSDSNDPLMAALRAEWIAVSIARLQPGSTRQSVYDVGQRPHSIRGPPVSI